VQVGPRLQLVFGFEEVAHGAKMVRVPLSRFLTDRGTH
jgi:hypothetical protein